MALTTSAQHRTTGLLMTNQAVGALTGIAFWVLLTRILGLSSHSVGLGYAIIAIASVIGLLGKAGLDTALMRHVPGAGSGAPRLLAWAVAPAVLATACLAALAALGAQWTDWLAEVDAMGWLAAGALGGLLVVAWLQDAFFLGFGRPGHTVVRNTVFAVGRLGAAVAAVIFGVPHPVAASWIVALAGAALVGWLLVGGLRARSDPAEPVDAPVSGPDPVFASAAMTSSASVPASVPASASGSARGGTHQRSTAPAGLGRFYRSAARNLPGSVAEALPGLLLVPVVLAVSGGAAAGHFSMAWTGASLLFLAAAAIGRSALAEMVRTSSAASVRPTLRRAMAQSVVLLLPPALLGIILAPRLMGIFGQEYAVHAAAPFAILCASTVFVVPAYLHLAVLRAQERPLALLVFPTGLVFSIFALAPALGARLGLAGFAWAWLAATAPFGVYGAWRLLADCREVNRDVSHSFGGRADAE